MKEIISTEKTKGKIVSEIVSDWETFCIHFTDNSCIVFVAEHGYEGGISVATPSVKDLEDVELLDLKIITREDYNTREKIRLIEDQKRLHRRYLELKNIFEEAKDETKL